MGEVRGQTASSKPQTPTSYKHGGESPRSRCSAGLASPAATVLCEQPSERPSPSFNLPEVLSEAWLDTVPPALSGKSEEQGWGAPQDQPCVLRQSLAHKLKG